MKTINNNNAISPVTGITIMVAIIIILTVIIMIYGTGISGHLNKYIVSASASQTGDDIIVQYRGGPHHNDMQYFNVTHAGSNTSGLPASIYKPHVKDTIILKNHGTAGRNDTVIVTAGFNDGTEQVILKTLV
jgi:hypothetical protein